MYKKTAVILNPSGLHARPASLLVSEAKKYSAIITIENKNRNADPPSSAKSIVSILSKGIKRGSCIELCGEGADEKEAVDALVNLINAGLGEQKA